MSKISAPKIISKTSQQYFVSLPQGAQKIGQKINSANSKPLKLVTFKQIFKN
jgi:hypothetical protein